MKKMQLEEHLYNMIQFLQNEKYTYELYVSIYACI